MPNNIPLYIYKDRDPATILRQYPLAVSKCIFSISSSEALARSV